ncbi:Histidine kinase-, DNA gyrase B-, and HSP90-like ATPase [Noviherbaspirillum humi]|uniref:Histidine kinase-, DNA gyrase B-, and HSP90-like ATPase n=1 Tax=Noviherbaspirillum humi TaxID=1688639 RepID=A0A239I701_9BURK|nr:response regulator [Noviherbaspirillum humi]SNS89261.1 Histidine kinase-, DNA gyrase B-, and HSP90-like ATPase [Noviherbaspirillum humi]
MPTEAGQRPHIRVLVVDDDVVDRIACRRAFAASPDIDFSMIEAETGREGLQLAREERPDCILLDYQLPDLDGLEFLTEITDDSGKPAYPVILLTGADSAAVAVTAMKRGAWDYIGKDTERRYLELLPGAIQRMLRERRLDEGKRQAEIALRQSQTQLRQLAAHLESVKEEERKRIAREIHDELGGLLTGIKAHVSVYLRRAARAGTPPDPLLTDAAGLADTALEAVRRVITDLRPSVLDQLGVWAALEWYAGQIEKRSGMQCTCRIDASAAAMELDAQRSTMLFRVVQEALTNVVRHADAGRVTIEAMCSDDVLTVEITDDGRGIADSGADKRESFGIIGMHERTRHFGGKLSITGTPGAGTRVLLRLPLETPHDE